MACRLGQIATRVNGHPNSLFYALLCSNTSSYSTSSSSSSSSGSSSSSDDSDSDSDVESKSKSEQSLHDVPIPKSAISSKLIDQILSMTVSKKIDDRHRVRDVHDIRDALDTELAKPTGKFKQLRAKLKEEHDAEQMLYQSGLNKELVSAVKEVASSLTGDAAKTESELLTKLKEHGQETTSGRAGASLGLAAMVSNMKIDKNRSAGKREHSSTEVERSSFLADRTEFHQHSRRGFPQTQLSISPKSMRSSKVDLFGAQPLGLFKTTEAKQQQQTTVISDNPRLELWKYLERRELDILVTHPPANGFEEMITWTRQGKLWHFPIDNEQGMDDEARVGFHEHVFLEPLIAEGFPKRGPIRHFMELVVVGLSKNPYMSVTTKREHVEWFRQYFEEKKEVLKEIGALG